MVSVAWAALGSNVGDRMKNLERAAAELSARGIKILKVSRVYETREFSGDKQRSYYNAVAALGASASPMELLTIFKAIEKKLGRRKSRRRGRPRPIDLDLLFYADERVSSKKLEVPHPRMIQRDFVLKPLAELTGRRKLPVFGKTASELLSAVEPAKRTIKRAAGFLKSYGGRK